MANWEVTKTKRYNKPIEEHTANTRSGAYKIEVPEGSRSGVLYRWDDLRGFERIASGDIASLKQQAESMGKREARGVAGIERLANMSRPGAPDTFAVEDKDEMGEQAEFRPGQSVKVLQGNKVVQGVIVKRKYDSLLGGEYYIVELPDPVHRGRIMPQSIPPSRILASRPGAPDTFAVEDRFYFGKGRKER